MWIIILLGIVVLIIWNLGAYLLTKRVVNRIAYYKTKKRINLKLKDMKPEEILNEINNKIEQRKNIIEDQKKEAGFTAGVSGGRAFTYADRELRKLKTEEKEVKKALYEKGLIDKEYN